MRNIDDFDSFILFSGDGDYAVLVEEIIKSRKQAIIIALKIQWGENITLSRKAFTFVILRSLKALSKKFPIKKLTGRD